MQDYNFPISISMGTNYCLGQNQKMLTLERNLQSLTQTKDSILTAMPVRSHPIQQIYQKLIKENPITYSIQAVKNKYQPIKISIFGQQGIFIGDVVNGKPHGPGQLYFLNQNFLEANFRSGQIYSDDAIFIESNGNFYRGGFKDSIQTGPGFLRTSGCEWKGYFSSGRISGSGQLQSQDGKYEGQFSNGKMEGKGKLLYKNGDVYEGYFRQGKREGIGYHKTKYYEYFGPFHRGMKEGKGTLILPNGSKYEGWFSKDKLHGYGQFHRKNIKIEKQNYQYAQLHTLF